MFVCTNIVHDDYMIYFSAFGLEALIVAINLITLRQSHCMIEMIALDIMCIYQAILTEMLLASNGY